MTRAQRALQAWTLLVCAVRDRRVYTYNEVRKVLGLGGAGVVGGLLDSVMRYCERWGLPPLTVLVVNEKTGLPGVGLTAGGEGKLVYKPLKIG